MEQQKKSNKIIPHQKLNPRYMGTRFSQANVTMNQFNVTTKQSISNERNGHNRHPQANKTLMTERLRNLYVNQYNKQNISSSRETHNMTSSNFNRDNG